MPRRDVDVPLVNLRILLFIVGGLSAAFMPAGCEIIAGIESLSVSTDGSVSESASPDAASGLTSSGDPGTGSDTSSGITGSGGTDGATDDGSSSSSTGGGQDQDGAATSSSSSGSTSSSTSGSSTSSSSGGSSSSSSSGVVQAGDGGGWVDMMTGGVHACDNKPGTPCGYTPANEGQGYTCVCFNGNYAVPWNCEPPNTCVILGPGCTSSYGAPICPADGGQ